MASLKQGNSLLQECICKGRSALATIGQGDEAARSPSPTNMPHLEWGKSLYRKYLLIFSFSGGMKQNLE